MANLRVASLSQPAPDEPTSGEFSNQIPRKAALRQIQEAAYPPAAEGIVAAAKIRGLGHKPTISGAYHLRTIQSKFTLPERATQKPKEQGEIGTVKKVLIFAAIGEFATGIALQFAPIIVGQLLLGQDLIGVTVLIARVTGIALVALAIASWPGLPVVGMLTYSTGVTLCLGYAGYAADATGVLLWPAVGLHGILTAVLIWAFARRA